MICIVYIWTRLSLPLVSPPLPVVLYVRLTHNIIHLPCGLFAWYFIIYAIIFLLTPDCFGSLLPHTLPFHFICVLDSYSFLLTFIHYLCATSYSSPTGTHSFITFWCTTFPLTDGSHRPCFCDLLLITVPLTPNPYGPPCAPVLPLPCVCAMPTYLPYILPQGPSPTHSFPIIYRTLPSPSPTPQPSPIVPVFIFLSLPLFGFLLDLPIVLALGLVWLVCLVCYFVTLSCPSLPSSFLPPTHYLSLSFAFTTPSTVLQPYLSFNIPTFPVLCLFVLPCFVCLPYYPNIVLSWFFCFHSSLPPVCVVPAVPYFTLPLYTCNSLPYLIHFCALLCIPLVPLPYFPIYIFVTHTQHSTDSCTVVPQNLFLLTHSFIYFYLVYCYWTHLYCCGFAHTTSHLYHCCTLPHPARRTLSLLLPCYPSPLLYAFLHSGHLPIYPPLTPTFLILYLPCSSSYLPIVVVVPCIHVATFDRTFGFVLYCVYLTLPLLLFCICI